MRHIVGDLSDCPHKVFDTVEHRVEILGQLVPFVLRASKWYSLAETAAHDVARGSVDGFDAPDRASRHRDPREGGEHQREYCPADQCGLDGPDESVEIVEPSADQKMRAVGQRSVGGPDPLTSGDLQHLEVGPSLNG